MTSNDHEWPLFKPPLCCWHAPGFKYLWRHHDSGQHQILKERCLKPLLKSTGNILLSTFAAFALVAYWHSPLPYFHESPRNEFLTKTSGLFAVQIKWQFQKFLISGLEEDNWDNMHVVKAMIVFGLGNFIGTTLNSIQFFDDFPSKYVPVMNIFGFIAMYIVNFFFTMRNYEHSMIVLERNVHENSCIWITWKSCETMIRLNSEESIFSCGDIS